MKLFTHLHVHSHFSLLESSIKIDELINKACRLGFNCIALTDKYVMHGAVQFYKLAKANNIKPIIGAEVCLLEYDTLSHLTILVKNKIGYQNICQLITKSYLNQQAIKKENCINTINIPFITLPINIPFITLQDLEIFSEGLICLSGCNKGMLAFLLQNKKFEHARKFAKKLYNIFGNDFYIEIQRYGFDSSNKSYQSAKFEKITQKFTVPTMPAVPVTPDASALPAISTISFVPDMSALSSALDAPTLSDVAAAGTTYESAAPSVSYTSSVSSVSSISSVSSVSSVFSETVVFELVKNFAQDLKLPLVATNDVHYLNCSDYKTYSYLAKLKLMSTKLDPTFKIIENNEHFLKSKQEMERLFFDIPQAINNTYKIAEKCCFDFDIGKIKLPRFKFKTSNNQSQNVQDDYKDKHKYEDKDEDKDEYKEEFEYEYLKKLCIEGLKYRFGNNPGKQIIQRLFKELEIIKKTGYSGYFLIVADIARFAFENNIPICGKGSAAGSLVSYLLKISNVNPIENNLYFERFLNLERKEPPDIDIDIANKHRDKIWNYLQSKYGLKNVARVVSFSTTKPRASLREASRLVGIPKEEIDYIIENENIYAYTKPKFSSTCKSTLLATELKLGFVSNQISGYARHASTHPSAFIVSENDLSREIPLMFSESGELMSQYDMNSIDDIGILKIDLINSLSLSLIADVLALIKTKKNIKNVNNNNNKNIHYNNYKSISYNKDNNDNNDKNIGHNNEKSINCKNTNEKLLSNPDFITNLKNIKSIPYNDKNVFNLIQQGKTLGVFQLESFGIRTLSRKIKPSSLNDITLLISLYRPGPQQSGMVKNFIERKFGREPITYIHKDLEPILKETYGLILYQEQAMQIAIKIAGYTFGEADSLRKAITTLSKDKMLSQQNRFIKGGIKRGYSLKVVSEIFSLISKFANYAFVKAHAAAYAELSYKTCYLKYYFPAEFFSTILTNNSGYYSKMQYIEEARRFGIKIKLPCVNESSLFSFNIEDDRSSIRVPLISIKNIGYSISNLIITEREKNGKFKDFFDFYNRMCLSESIHERMNRLPNCLASCSSSNSSYFSSSRSINSNAVENLIKIGAFDFTGVPRKKLLLTFYLLKNLKNQIKEEFNLKSITDFTLDEKLELEAKILGFYVSCNPISNFKNKLSELSELKFLSNLIVKSGCFYNYFSQYNFSQHNKYKYNQYGLTYSLLDEHNSCKHSSYNYASYLHSSHNHSSCGDDLCGDASCGDGNFLKHLKVNSLKAQKKNNFFLLTKEIITAGIIITKRIEKTKNKKDMLFCTLEDEDGMYEAVFFPEVYKDSLKTIMSNSFVLLKGRLCLKDGNVSLIVKNAYSINSINKILNLKQNEKTKMDIFN